ncbi:MAG TPA: hypothetical protein VKE96_04520 [Vicinamibacterales bacterium]|nr:hypothetical protein [Vicinamibacterales bacterium]
MKRAMRISAAIGLAAALTGVAATLTADQSPQVVQVRDDCDPATFNAGPPDGPGLGHICDGDGGTTFGEFIAELQATQVAEKWRFNPDQMSEPRNIVAQNRGGETHSFTKVAKFGGGQVPVLNALSGNPVPAPECLAASVGATFIPSGGSHAENGVMGGDKFQCCIHPWMRTTVRKR